jgi:hypothetical protein
MEDDYVDEDYEHTAAKLNETNPHNTAEETAGESEAQGGVGPKYSSSSPTTSTYHLSLILLQAASITSASSFISKRPIIITQMRIHSM